MCIFESVKSLLKLLVIQCVCRRRKKTMRGGSVVMDWDQIVRHLTVSSNESQAYRLIDASHSTFWQSSGPQGKVGTRCVL